MWGSVYWATVYWAEVYWNRVGTGVITDVFPPVSATVTYTPKVSGEVSYQGG